MRFAHHLNWIPGPAVPPEDDDVEGMRLERNAPLAYVLLSQGMRCWRMPYHRHGALFSLISVIASRVGEAAQKMRSIFPLNTRGRKPRADL